MTEIIPVTRPPTFLETILQRIHRYPTYRRRTLTIEQTGRAAASTRSRALLVVTLSDYTDPDVNVGVRFTQGDPRQYDWGRAFIFVSDRESGLTLYSAPIGVLCGSGHRAQSNIDIIRVTSDRLYQQYQQERAVMQEIGYRREYGLWWVRSTPEWRVALTPDNSGVIAVYLNGEQRVCWQIETSDLPMAALKWEMDLNPTPRIERQIPRRLFDRAMTTDYTTTATKERP